MKKVTCLVVGLSSDSSHFKFCISDLQVAYTKCSQQMEACTSCLKLYLSGCPWQARCKLSESCGNFDAYFLQSKNRCFKRWTLFIIICTILPCQWRIAPFVTLKPLWMVMGLRNQVIIAKPGYTHTHKYLLVGVERGWLHFFLTSWKLKGP